MNLTVEEVELIELCKQKYLQYYKLKEIGYKNIKYQTIINDIDFYESHCDEFLSRILNTFENLDEKKKQYWTSIVGYEYFYSGYKKNSENRICNCQSGFHSKIIDSYNIKSVFNDEINKNDFVKWCIYPEGNVSVDEHVFDKTTHSVINSIGRNLNPRKKVEYIMVIPPFSKQLNFEPSIYHKKNEKYLNKGDSIYYTNYSSLLDSFERDELYFQYILEKREDGSFYLIVSSYEKSRGKILCNGILGFDSDTPNTEEMSNIEQTTIVIENGFSLSKDSKSIQNQTVFYECQENVLPILESYTSFLATHSDGFFEKGYRANGIITELVNKDFMLNKGDQFTPQQIYINNFGREDISKIPLGDMISISNAVEKNYLCSKTDITNNKDFTLGTLKNIERKINFHDLLSIPSNYSQINWKLRNENEDIKDYWNLPEEHSIDDFIKSLLKKNGSNTTEDIAEELLYDVRNVQNEIPSALFVSSLFLYLSQMKNIECRIRSFYVPKRELENKISNLENKRKISKQTIQKKPVSNSKITRKPNLFIEELDLSVRTYRMLKKAGINTTDKLSKYNTMEKLLRIKNLGRKGAREILMKLSSMGYKIDY